MDELTVMNAEEMGRTIVRLARDVLDRHGSVDGLVVIGIQRRGAILGERLADAVASIEGVRPPVGSLDISLYRDDLSELGAYPVVRPTDLPFSLAARTVVLVDDVLYTGRTVRAALSVLVDHGRADRIGLAVLVDRGHRELPIRADHVGRYLPTGREERVHVRVAEVDGRDEVAVGRRGG